MSQLPVAAQTTSVITGMGNAQKTSKLDKILFDQTCDMLGAVLSKARPSIDSQTFPIPHVEWGLSQKHFHSRQQYFSAE